MVLISGALVSLWPELSFREAGAWSYLRASAGVATSSMLAIWLCMSPTSAYAAAPRPKVPVVATHGPSRPLPTGALGAVGAGLGLGALVAIRRRRAR
jgi:cytochrome c-type biogenesis protein CcmF